MRRPTLEARLAGHTVISARRYNIGSPVRVALVALPEAMVGTLSGIYEVLTCFDLLSAYDENLPSSPPFAVDIVGPPHTEVLETTSRLPISIHRTWDQTDEVDIVILPAVTVVRGGWQTGRHPSLVGWLLRMHGQGATICSACSGSLLLAETGLLDCRTAAVHWAQARTFRRAFPDVDLRLDQALLVTGEREEFLMSGASASWQDLVLYLIGRRVSPAAAQAISKLWLMQWHEHGQTPFIVFEPPTDHGDRAILQAQRWIHDHLSSPSPATEMVRRSDLAERTFHRRFKKVTGMTPLQYVHQLRVEEAKRRLERTDASIEDIGWAVGYEDAAFFGRLFKRTVSLTPSAYRRKFRFPGAE